MPQAHYKLMVPDNVSGLIRSMHPHLKKKVRASLKLILSNPHSGKSLKDELSGLISFRVSRFRIIYRISQKKYIEIIAIGPRERIYEDTYRIIRRGEQWDEWGEPRTWYAKEVDCRQLTVDGEKQFPTCRLRQKNDRKCAICFQLGGLINN